MSEDPRPGAVRPVWALDFDGVVNAIAGRRPDRAVWSEWVETSTDAYDGRPARVVVALPVLDFVSRALAAGVDVRWVSDWGPATAALPALLEGLPELSFEDPEDHAVPGLWWKHAFALSLAPGTPLVWTDDLLSGYDRECYAALRYAEASASVLPIAPASVRGLTLRDLREVSAFLARHGVDVAPPAHHVRHGRAVR